MFRHGVSWVEHLTADRQIAYVLIYHINELWPLA